MIGRRTEGLGRPVQALAEYSDTTGTRIPEGAALAGRACVRVVWAEQGGAAVAVSVPFRWLQTKGRLASQRPNVLEHLWPRAPLIDDPPAHEVGSRAEQNDHGPVARWRRLQTDVDSPSAGPARH